MLSRAATRGRRRRARVAAGLLSVLSTAALCLLTASPSAEAAPQDPSCTAQVSRVTGRVTYVCTGPGRTGGPGRGPVQGPSCRLTGNATFCMGTLACWIMPGDKDLYPPPPGPPPTPGADWAVRSCTAGPGSVWQDQPIWLGPTPATLLVAARRAVGNLRLPQVTAASAPPTQTLVNLDTWFAPAGAVNSPVRGTSALGVTAVATLTIFTIDPGDGTSTLSCPPAATLNRTAGCAHTYRRSSAGQTATTPDGRPGYQVRAWTTWRIDYLQGNNPVTIPGAATTVTGPVATRILPVAEAQTIVGG